MATPKKLEIKDILHLRASDGETLLPLPIEFRIYEPKVDEELIQYERMLERATDDEEKDILRRGIAKIRGMIEDSEIFTGHFRPIKIGEWNEYVALGIARKSIVLKHFVNQDGTPAFTEKELEFITRPDFLPRAFDALCGHSGIVLSKAAQESVRTSADLRLREAKKKLNLQIKASSLSAPATSSPSGDSSPGISQGSPSSS